MLFTRQLLYLYECKILVFSILIIAAFGCHSKRIKNIEFFIHEKKTNVSDLSNKDFKTKQIVLKSEDIHGLFTNLLVVDSFLICGNLRSSKLVSIYSLKNDSLLAEIIQRGNEQHQGLSIANLCHESGSRSNLWAYDITLSKLFKINLLKAVKDSHYMPECEITLPKELKNILSPEIINDSLFVATTYIRDDTRYIYASCTKINKKIGKLPDVENDQFLADPPETKFPNRAYIFKATGVKHPLENKIAIFYNKTDRVEFYKGDSLIKTLIGPNHFGPKMHLTKLKSGFSLEDFNGTKYSYTSVTYTNKFIYCLYSGLEARETRSNKIFVFDWNGEFQEELILDRPVCKIYINPKENVIYCYDNLENGIYSTFIN